MVAVNQKGTSPTNDGDAVLLDRWRMKKGQVYDYPPLHSEAIESDESCTTS
jgi:hypothetical protein